MIDQDLLIMYLASPIIALFIYLTFKILSHFKW